ncbi:MAG: hypothetical protein ACMXYC_04350 [Candidatus Woesearchaeota archaeon]
MTLLQIANTLSAARIENLEQIAKRIRADTQAEYNQKFVQEIVRQKILNSEYASTHHSDTYPYKITEDDGSALVAIAPEEILPDTRNNELKKFIRETKEDLEGYLGLIQFLPFQMNGNPLRANLQKQLPIQFVNMPYNKRDMERRFRAYSN